MNTYDIIYLKQQAYNYFLQELQTYFHDAKLLGKLKARLGITDDITLEKIFSDILDHKNPVNPQEKLTPNKCKRLLFAFAVSAPKCFSILSIFLDDEQLYKIHRAAANESMDFLEKYAGVRKRENKRQDTKITGETLRFHCEHRLSRKNDPQLHSHECFFNLTWDDDKKKYMALDPGLMGTLCPLATQIYRNLLVRGMRNIGISASITDKGEVQIDGIPEELCKKYSKRKDEIDGFVKAYEEKHDGIKCGKKFRAKVANACKDPKCSPAEEVKFLADFRDEIESSGWADTLRNIAQPKKEQSIAKKVIGYFQNKRLPVEFQSAIDVLRDTEKNTFGKQSSSTWFKYLHAAMIEAKDSFTYEEISEAYNARIKNKEIHITPAGEIIFNRVSAQNKKVEAVYVGTKNTKRQMPFTLSDISESENYPIARKLLQNNDNIVLVEEDKEDSYSSDLKFFAECTNRANMPVFYLNAHRATKRKKVCSGDKKISKDKKPTKPDEAQKEAPQNIARAMTFKGLSALKYSALIIVDNANFVEPDYMLKLLTATKATKSKLLLVSRKNDTKVNGFVDSLGLLKSNGLKPIDEITPMQTQPAELSFAKENLQTTKNCLQKFLQCYNSKSPAKFVCLSEAERTIFEDNLSHIRAGRLKDGLIEVYPNIARDNKETIVFVSDKCPHRLFAEITSAKDKHTHIFKTDTTAKIPPSHSNAKPQQNPPPPDTSPVPTQYSKPFEPPKLSTPEPPDFFSL